jgi:hypothetical protein
MKIILHHCLWIITLAAFLGCGPGNNRTKDTASVTPVVKGKIIPKVACRKDYTISYALYLPKNYSAALKFPAIIAFDPKGNGILPLEKYKDLADKYGYILMGSNDSRNGLDMNTTSNIIDALFSETSGPYSIDSTRIYVMGFSGGARIASMIGLYQGGVAGIIGCGAGFPSINQPARFMPDYISIAGTADFNMNELISLDKQLEEAKFTHASILFNGRHAWPPAEVMENAFIWTGFCSMRKHFIPKDDSLIARFTGIQNRIIKQDMENRDALAAHSHLINLIRFVDGLSPTEDYKKTLAEIENSATYKTQEKQLQLLIGKETNEQRTLNDNFFLKDLDWWKRKIANYETRIQRGTDSSDVRMCKRLKSYLSLLSYMSYNRSLSSNDSTAAEHSMQIYEIVDPENAAATKAEKRK